MANTDFNSQEYLEKVNAYWRAANYIGAAQLYMLDNPLLRQPLTREQVKKKIVGHWGTVPGQNFIYAHMNRAINKYDLDMMLISGPGHGGNFFVGNSYLEGHYSEIYPNISEDEEGMKKLCKQFSFACGISSHVAPETPGSIHEGGELGYSLAHSFGAVFDNPELVVACVVGDGEAETGPLATGWQSNKFLNPVTDGAVLPILHLNEYKISNPTVLSHISHDELQSYFHGMGWEPFFVEYTDPEINGDAMKMHEKMAAAVDSCIEKIKAYQKDARENGNTKRPFWPMIVLRSPKGWTGPKVVDGVVIEGSFDAHQVPITMDKPEHLDLLKEWLLSYKPEELFTEDYKLIPELKEMAPKGDRRISANPHANGGLLRKELKTPNVKDYAVDVPFPGSVKKQDMIELGNYVRDLFVLNKDEKNFRVFGPDESKSNRLYHMFEVENRTWEADSMPNDEWMSTDGRIMDGFLSEHMCEGWLEAYILTGRHGFFASYEAFLRVVDSMIGQHAKWLKIVNALEWRADISSLNLICASNVWQQDHNGYTHQEPGILDLLNNKKSSISRMYLPADANSLIVTFDHCIKSKNKINIIVASKHPSCQWLTMDQAIENFEKGAMAWDWASNDNGDPDIVIASCGDTPTLEGLAAVQILREELPELKVRFVNVTDLMKLQSADKHPHGLTDEEFDNLFTTDKPVIFAFHGYIPLIHELTYFRHNKNISVHGYQEEGSITTPFDMRVQNEIDRFHLVADALSKLNSDKTAKFIDEMNAKLVEHKKYIAEVGLDLPEIANWKWSL